MAESLNDLILGMVAMGWGTAALFFFKFWKQTGDRLFGLFAFAFIMLALNRIALGLVPVEVESRSLLYWVRLAAYLIILYAIVDKNWPRQRAR